MAQTARITPNATCHACGWRVYRMNVSYHHPAHGRYVLFDPDPAGAWIQDPITGYMRRVGIEAITDLDRWSLHHCLDDPALD